MSKSDQLKEKKKALNDEAKKGKELFKMEIIVDDKENITVNGPINDPLLVMRLLSGAMNVVVDHNFSTAKLNAEIEAGRKEKEAAKIMNGREVPKENRIIKLN